MLAEDQRCRSRYDRFRKIRNAEDFQVKIDSLKRSRYRKSCRTNKSMSFSAQRGACADSPRDPGDSAIVDMSLPLSVVRRSHVAKKMPEPRVGQRPILASSALADALMSLMSPPPMALSPAPQTRAAPQSSPAAKAFRRIHPSTRYSS